MCTHTITNIIRLLSLYYNVVLSLFSILILIISFDVITVVLLYFLDLMQLQGNKDSCNLLICAFV